LTAVAPGSKVARVSSSSSNSDDRSTSPGPPASVAAPKAAIFDHDGTLADSMPVHFRAWQEVAGRHRLVFPETRFYALGGVPTVKIAATLIAEQGLSLDPAAICHEKEEAVLRRFHEIRAIPAVVELARQHRANGKVAVASGGGRVMVERTLHQLGLHDWFPVVVAAEDTVRHKPEPDVFLEAARRLGVAPGDCIVYEDTDLGLEAARRAGMRGVDVRPLYGAGSGQPGAQAHPRRSQADPAD
jgi:HAD superfamily hydrolase (TIGR01509 family)